MTALAASFAACSGPSPRDQETDPVDSLETEPIEVVAPGIAEWMRRTGLDAPADTFWSDIDTLDFMDPAEASSADVIPRDGIDYWEVRSAWFDAADSLRTIRHWTEPEEKDEACTRATDRAACLRTFVDAVGSGANAQPVQPSSLFQFEYLVATSGDSVIVADWTDQTNRELLGQIDSPREALMRARASGFNPDWIRPVQRAYEIIARDGPECSPGPVLRLLVRVNEQGVVRVVREQAIAWWDAVC